MIANPFLKNNTLYNLLKYVICQKIILFLIFKKIKTNFTKVKLLNNKKIIKNSISRI